MADRSESVSRHGAQCAKLAADTPRPFDGLLRRGWIPSTQISQDEFVNLPYLS